MAVIGTLLRVFAVTAAFTAVLYGLRLDRQINKDAPTVLLGDTSYVKSDLKAPVVTGLPLAIFNFVATRTPFGGAIRRFLLNDNDILQLRELAAQMPPDVVPLSHPMRRLSRTERDAHDAGAAAAAAAGTAVDSIVPFVAGGEDLVQASALRHSQVLKLHKRLLAGKTTASAITHQALSEIDRLQPVYKLFTAQPLRQEMLAAAAASDARFAAGAPLSVFDGVPVAFKDMIAVRGYVLTDGSSFNRQLRPASAKDDLIVKRFRDLGAIILPPTSMTEGGVSPVGYCVDVQGPFNPHHAAHYSGGSSGGSAVAVALGITPVAIGYDGGGSIRTPASLSGVVGFATGFGRLPFESHLTGTNIKGGPLAATVADAALAYAVMARPLPEGRSSLYDEMYDGGYHGVPAATLSEFLRHPHPPAGAGAGSGGSAAKDLVGIKLGVMREWFDDSDPAVRDVTWAGVAALVARGASVVDVAIPNLSQGRLAHALTIAAEFGLDWDPAVGHAQQHLVEANTHITVGLGKTVTAVEVKSCEKIRAYLFAYLRDNVFTKVDALVTPATPISAPVVPAAAQARGENNAALNVELLKYVYVANFLGLPSASVPVGVDASNDGVPVGLMLTAAWWQEDRLFRIAQAAESASSTQVPKPKDYRAL